MKHMIVIDQCWGMVGVCGRGGVWRGTGVVVCVVDYGRYMKGAVGRGFYTSAEMAQKQCFKFNLGYVYLADGANDLGHFSTILLY